MNYLYRNLLTTGLINIDVQNQHNIVYLQRSSVNASVIFAVFFKVSYEIT